MSDSPLIPEATRNKVQALLRELGYERDPMLRALVADRKNTAPVHYHGTIAWLLTNQHRDTHFYAALQENFLLAEKAARPLGYTLEEFRIGDGSPARIIRQLAPRGINGVLFPPQLRPDVELDLDLRGFAAVRIGETLERPTLNCVLPNQYQNTFLFLDHLHKAGWQRIGFYLPQGIDWRSSGTFSAAYWHWQQNQPPAQRLEIGLPQSRAPEHYARWLEREQPELVVGLPVTLKAWVETFQIREVPCGFPALVDHDPQATTMDENWPTIYLCAIRLLDNMIRHGESGLPENPRRIVITGRWLPGKWGSRNKEKTKPKKTGASPVI